MRPSGLVRFLAEQSVKDLPGVGPAIAHALNERNIRKLADLIALPKEDLQNEFGEKVRVVHVFCLFLWDYNHERAKQTPP